MNTSKFVFAMAMVFLSSQSYLIAMKREATDSETSDSEIQELFDAREAQRPYMRVEPSELRDQAIGYDTYFKLSGLGNVYNNVPPANHSEALKRKIQAHYAVMLIYPPVRFTVTHRNKKYTQELDGKIVLEDVAVVAKNHDGSYNSIHEAVIACDLDAVQTMISKNKTNLNKSDRYGAKPLHYSFAFGYGAISELLIRAGARTGREEIDWIDHPYFKFDPAESHCVLSANNCLMVQDLVTKVKMQEEYRRRIERAKSELFLAEAVLKDLEDTRLELVSDTIK